MAPVESLSPPWFTARRSAASTVGAETVRGVTTVRYHALVDFERYAATSHSGAQARRYAATLRRLTGSSTLPIDVWVDAQQRIRRLSTSVSACSPEGRVSTRIALDIFDFGARVVVPVHVHGVRRDERLIIAVVPVLEPVLEDSPF